MDADSFGAVLIVAIGLVAAPLIAFASFASTRGRWVSSQRPMAIACGSVLLVIAGVATLGFSFKSVLANFTSFVVAYGAYCFLAVSCWRIRFWPLRALALLCAAIPILAGYVLSTVGLLGLILIIGDYTRAPSKVEQMDIGLVCRVTGWGSAVTDSGYTVHLYRTWDWLPLIERSVISISINELDGSTEDSTCADALRQYRG